MPTPIASQLGVASSAPPPSVPVTAPAPSPTTHTPSPLQHSATAPSSAAASPTKSRKLFASLRSKSYDKATSSIRTLGRRASNDAAPPPVPGLPASLSVPPPATADPPRRRSGDAGRPSLHLDTAIGVATSSTPMGSASSSFNLRSFRQVSGVRMEPVRSHTPSSSSPIASPSLGYFASAHETSRSGTPSAYDPLASRPASPGITASQFRQARAARSSASVHTMGSRRSSFSGSVVGGAGSLIGERTSSKLDLPILPPPTAVRSVSYTSPTQECVELDPAAFCARVASAIHVDTLC